MPSNLQPAAQAGAIAGTSNSGKLSQNDIYLLALHTGMNAGRAKVAAAIAMAESGGDPNAHNDKPPDDSYGLWQINMLGSLGPARREHFKLSSNDQLLNPTTNAAAMYSISLHGGNFSPWSTYTNGSYQKFMSNPVSGTKADSESAWSKFLHWDPLGVDKGIHKVVDPVLDAAGATAAALGNLVEFIGKTAVWISDAKNWVRIAYVTGGSVVVVGGIVMVLRSSSTGQAAIKTAKRIKP